MSIQSVTQRKRKYNVKLCDSFNSRIYVQLPLPLHDYTTSDEFRARKKHCANSHSCALNWFTDRVHKFVLLRCVNNLFRYSFLNRCLLKSVGLLLVISACILLAITVLYSTDARSLRLLITATCAALHDSTLNPPWLHIIQVLCWSQILGEWPTPARLVTTGAAQNGFNYRRISSWAAAVIDQMTDVDANDEISAAIVRPAPFSLRLNGCGVSSVRSSSTRRSGVVICFSIHE